MLHIIIISDWETYPGGAAITASRLADSFVAAGHRVTRIVHVPDDKEHAWQTRTLPDFSAFRRRIARRLLPSSMQLKLNSRFIRRHLSEILKELQPDIINVHNIHWAFPFGWQPDLLATCSAHAPTVWTLHDMWSFTGRCAHSLDCEKYISGCDESCPTPEEYPVLQPHLIARQWQKRARLFASEMRLVAVTPSVWLARLAKKGFWRNHRVEVIPNGVPVDAFVPQDRLTARQELAIEPSGKVLLMVSTDLSARFKGVIYAMEALKKLTDIRFTVIAIGGGELPISPANHHFHKLGTIDNDQTKTAYSAADALLHPAIAEVFGIAVAESFACGTPAIAFPVGGLPELVRPGVSGWLADEVSSESLARVIRQANVELTKNDFRQSCRTLAEQEYDLRLQANRYLELFQELAQKAAVASMV